MLAICNFCYCYSYSHYAYYSYISLLQKLHERKIALSKASFGENPETRKKRETILILEQ